MTATLSLTDSQILTALRSFLTTILPANVQVIKGQINRVSEPQPADFVVMTPILRQRIETNTDSYADAAFTGSISGGMMTITDVIIGALVVGSPITGTGVSAGTIVQAFGSGTGGLGTYTVSPSQTVSSTILQAGTRSFLGPVNITVQLDVHGPNSADNAQIITSLFRDGYACWQFTESGYEVQPLYADEARQLPFVNAEQQWEYRYVIDAVMQANPITGLTQQFAGTLGPIQTIEIDEAYPP